MKLCFLCLIPFFFSCKNALELSTTKMSYGEKVDKNDAISLHTVRVGEWCTGSLVARDWVLTAAHCIHGFKVEDFMVYFGDLKVAASSVKIHPKYNTDSIRARHDVALIKLSKSAPDTFKAINLISIETQLKLGDSVYIAGYGKFGSAKYFELKRLVEKRVLELAESSSDEKVTKLLVDYRKRITNEENAKSNLMNVVSSFKYSGSMPYPANEISMAAQTYREERSNRDTFEFDQLMGETLKKDETLNNLRLNLYMTDPQGAGDKKLYKAGAKVDQMVHNYVIYQTNDPLVGSCQGDSGGPMYVEKNDTLYQVGLAHGSNREDYKSSIDICGGSGLYTYIYPYLDFISSAIK